MGGRGWEVGGGWGDARVDMRLRHHLLLKGTEAGHGGRSRKEADLSIEMSQALLGGCQRTQCLVKNAPKERQSVKAESLKWIPSN